MRGNARSLGEPNDRSLEGGMANTFRCKLAHKKAFFAVLTDERNASLFSDADIDAIRAHVPWRSRLLLRRTREETT